MRTSAINVSMFQQAMAKTFLSIDPLFLPVYRLYSMWVGLLCGDSEYTLFLLCRISTKQQQRGFLITPILRTEKQLHMPTLPSSHDVPTGTVRPTLVPTITPLSCSQRRLEPPRASGGVGVDPKAPNFPSPPLPCPSL